MKQTKRSVYKAHGAGNDFVMLIGSEQPVADEMAAAALSLCDRHRGIGADGLVWIDTSAMPGMVNVRVWNPDGSVVGMCLNAARCVFVLLHELFAIERVEIRFANVAVQATASQGGARLEFELPATAQTDQVVHGIADATWFVNLADPHVVIGWRLEPAIYDAPLAEIAYAHASGGGLADRPPNCHLVSPGHEPMHHRIRSFERRVEAETLACGSGCVASYLALSLDGEHTFHTGSGDRIRLSRSGSRWSLEGPAVLVFDTLIDIAASSQTR